MMSTIVIQISSLSTKRNRVLKKRGAQLNSSKHRRSQKQSKILSKYKILIYPFQNQKNYNLKDYQTKERIRMIKQAKNRVPLKIGRFNLRI